MRKIQYRKYNPRVQINSPFQIQIQNENVGLVNYLDVAYNPQKIFTKWYGVSSIQEWVIVVRVLFAEIG